MSNVTPSDKRTSRWNRKYDPERIKQINEEGKPEYLAAVTTVNIELEQMEIATKTILNVEGVSVADVANYLAFSRELWKKSKTYSAQTLALEAQVIQEKWTSRGLSMSVCEAIKFGVYGISAPAGP